jgi:hypothetical protein
MRAIFGYTFFWIAVGMIIAIVIPNIAITLLLITILLILGYNLFC